MSLLSIIPASWRVAQRLARRDPSFLSFVSTLYAICFSSALVLFTIAYVTAFEPLALERSSELYSLIRTGPSGSVIDVPWSIFQEVRATGFPTAQAFRGVSLPVWWPNGEIELTRTALVTPEFLQTVGVSMTLGRGFTAQTASTVGGEATGMLSHKAWQKRFGGRSSILGQQIVISERRIPVTITGVLPKGFDLFSWLGEDRIELVLSFSSERGGISSTVPVQVIVRSPNSTIPRLVSGPHAGSALRLESVPLRERVFGNLRRPLAVAFLGWSVVLAIAIAILGSLWLARTSARKHMASIQVALGASTASLIWETVIEGLMASFAGVTIGCAIGWWTLLSVALAAQRSGLLRVDPEKIRPTLPVWICLVGVWILVTMLSLLPSILQRLGAARMEGASWNNRQSTPSDASLRWHRILVGLLSRSRSEELPMVLSWNFADFKSNRWVMIREIS